MSEEKRNKIPFVFIFSISLVFCFSEIVSYVLALLQWTVVVTVFSPPGAAVTAFATLGAGIVDFFAGTAVLDHTVAVALALYLSTPILSLFTFVTFILLAGLLAKDFIRLHDYFVAIPFCFLEMIPVVSGGIFWVAFGIYLARSMALRKFSSTASSLLPKK